MRIPPAVGVQIADAGDRSHVPPDARLLGLEHHPEAHPHGDLGVRRLVVLGQGDDELRRGRPAEPRSHGGAL